MTDRKRIGLDQVDGSMRVLAVDLQRVARMQPIHRAAVAVVHDALEHVDELGARMLEQRIGLALFRQRDVQARQPLVLTPSRALAEQSETKFILALFVDLRGGEVRHGCRTLSLEMNQYITL
jgi:hypothetical protein